MTDVRMVELCMHDLTYGGHRPDGITHRPNGCRNLNACQTLNDVRTV
jgi:hypothetical protein